MTDTGRNEPCPCGSGKKYKKCCLLKEQVQTVTRLILMKTSDELMPKLLKYFHKLQDMDSIEEAWEDFSGCELESSFYDSPYEDMIFRWMLFLRIPEDYILDDEEPVYPASQTIGARFLRDNRRNLDSVTVKYLEAALSDPLSFWQVEAVSPGRGIMARDIITGRERFIEDVSCSESLHNWDILLANTIEVDGTCVFNIFAPFPLPPRMAETILDTFGVLCTYPEDEALRDLFESDYDLIWYYQKIVDELMNRPLPTLKNTDGDDLVLTKSTYEFDPSERDNILDKLMTVEEFEIEPGSSKVAVSYIWNATSKQQTEMDTVVKGTINVKKKYLETECNSAERND
ncbi:MAG: SEC-C domain-containing protein, partial [Deltaproteobacteria bacterium]|nr:SEC-C domain-containing protein [Deltaproteobacteria bacterium]